jgi:5-methyltetrahydropteroyltriglutamate--homocysteine methyltransferase
MPTTPMPPFRAEHIGSLLRPATLLAERARFERGEVTREALRAAEDAAIRQALAMQERVGLKLATDGEFRRRSYHSYFYRQLGDIRIDTVGGEDAKGGNAGHRGSQPVAVVGSHIRWTHPINAADHAFVAANTKSTSKITIPGPCALHFRGGNEAVLATAYTDMEQFWSDTIEAFVAELVALDKAGCHYVQIDETAFAKFGDAEVQSSLAARGDDWSRLIDTYIDVTNRILRRAPVGMAIGMHLCRGNRGGQWHAEGSYEEVAERLFNTLEIPFYFLEYDSPRAGNFQPLRAVPTSKRVVLGLVSTKAGTLEKLDDLKARVDEAGRFVDIDRLAVSPQCGFASVETGNPLSEAEQEAKLRLVVDLARAVWGEA